MEQFAPCEAAQVGCRCAHLLMRIPKTSQYYPAVLVQGEDYSPRVFLLGNSWCLPGLLVYLGLAVDEQVQAENGLVEPEAVDGMQDQHRGDHLNLCLSQPTLMLI